MSFWRVMKSPCVYDGNLKSYTGKGKFCTANLLKHCRFCSTVIKLLERLPQWRKGQTGRKNFVKSRLRGFGKVKIHHFYHHFLEIQEVLRMGELFLYHFANLLRLKVSKTEKIKTKCTKNIKQTCRN